MKKQTSAASQRQNRLLRRLGILAASTLVGIIAVAGIIAASSDAPVSTIAIGIFPDDLAPATSADSDRGAVELGIRFSPRQAGRVTALQFYQGTANVGVTSATLWSEDGRILARTSFAAAEEVGWRTVALASPVALEAARTYVASYQAPHGEYAATAGALAGPQVLNGFELTANAGVYRYGATDEVPNETYNGANYFVDIVYEVPGATAAPTPTDGVAPTASPIPTTDPTPTTTSAPPPADGYVALGRTFPSAATTGVPEGVTLKPYTGPCTIFEEGYVIDAKRVNCELRIFARNVVIKNSFIEGRVYADYTENRGAFTIIDSEIHAPDGPWTGIGDAFFTAERVEVTGGARSINCYAYCTVKDSYVHGQFTDETGQHHESGIRVNTHSTLVGNTIACDAPDIPPDAGCSAAISGYGDFDIVEHVTIQDNLVVAGSGGYCSYGGSSAGKPYASGVNNVKFLDNVYQKGVSGQCGFWGAITSFDSAAPGNVWSNNLYDDGTPVPPAN